MQFPIQDLLDEDLSYEWLKKHLHPEGLKCPEGHALPLDQSAHKRNRQGIPSFRCRTCGCVFNVFTGTVFSKARYAASTIVLVLRGIARGETTLKLSAELGIDRTHLHAKRQQIQALLVERFPPLPSARHRGRGRRDVPERRREGASPSFPR